MVCACGKQDKLVYLFSIFTDDYYQCSECKMIQRIVTLSDEPTIFYRVKP
jgi:hypothetical protein